MDNKDERPMHILYVLPYVPSPIRVRPFQFIRHLTALGHKITVVALEDGLATTEVLSEITRICEAVHVVALPRYVSLINALVSLPTSTPLWAAWCRSPRMSRLLRQLAASSTFDIVHVEHLRAAHFRSSLGSLPCIIDAVDCITDLRRQMAVQKEGRLTNRFLSWLEWRKVRAYEPRAYRKFQRIAVTSEHDSLALRELAPDLPEIDVVSNGVDLDFFDSRGIKPEDNCLVFSGKMSYIANDDAARHLIATILPRIRALRSGTRLTIVGSGPSKSLRKEAALAGNVQVTGFVDDIRPYLRSAAISVCPMRIGVGIQNKVLEGMASARPVVCSALAARSLNHEASDAAGVHGRKDRPVVVADDPDHFAQSCVHLLDRPDEAMLRGRSARCYVEKYHDWKLASIRLAHVYRAVASNGC